MWQTYDFQCAHCVTPLSRQKLFNIKYEMNVVILHVCHLNTHEFMATRARLISISLTSHGAICRITLFFSNIKCEIWMSPRIMNTHTHTHARQPKVVNNGSLCFIVGDILGGKLYGCKLSGMLFLEIVLIFPVTPNDVHLNREKTKRAFQAIFPMFNSQWDVINVSGIANKINLMRLWLKIESKTLRSGILLPLYKGREKVNNKVHQIIKHKLI